MIRDGGYINLICALATAGQERAASAQINPWRLIVIELLDVASRPNVGVYRPVNPSDTRIAAPRRAARPAPRYR